MFEILAFILCALFAIPVAVFSFQVLMSLAAHRTAPAECGERSESSVAVLVPAHNEEILIGETIENLLPQLGPNDSLLVVADNCSDDTAVIAEKAGAEVLIRQDSNRRGKGYALDFGIKHIGSFERQPDVIVIIDADCSLEEKGIDVLASECLLSQRPVQARYLMHRSKDSPGQKVAEFAWLVKNWVRPLGYWRLGLPCQLMGTGMAFPFGMLHDVNLAGSNIVEDMQLGIDLARAGHAPQYCPQVVVDSTFPTETESIQAQRTRWEHGHMHTILTQGFKLLGQALFAGNFKLLAMALDLMVPPLAFLALSLFALLAATLAFSLFHLTGPLPFAVSIAVCTLFAGAVIVAWSRYARHVLSPNELFSIPFYVLRKIPIYARFWKKRQKDWVRTGRD